MAKSYGSLGETDIGPVPDGSASGSRKVQADNVDPVVEADEQIADAPAAEAAPPAASRKTNGAAEQDAKTNAATGKHKKTAAPPSSAVDPNGHPLPPAGGAGKRRTAPGTVGFWPEIDCSKTHQEVESALYECMKTKYGRELVTDMDDAQLLLSYVTRNGLQEDRKINDEVIKNLIVSRQRLRAGVFESENEEAKFRAAYGVLSKAAQPVTVASLRDSTATGLRHFLKWNSGRPYLVPEARPVAEIACLRYRNFAFLVLAILLLVQIYWTASSSVLNKTESLIAEINKAPSAEFYIEQEALRISGLKAVQGNTEPTPASRPSPTVTPTTTSNPRRDRRELTLDELVSKIGELNANYSMLGKFMAPFAWFYFESNQPKAAPEKEKNSQAKPPPLSPTPGKEPDPTATTARDPNAIFVPSEFQNKSASIRAIAGQVIDVMQKWLLPLLYGALGAMVFVVRTLSMQARDRLFRREALVPLILRVFLGMISGLAIGWFWNRTDATAAGGPMSLNTLSPFALAFIAGYGVELFFALLDKLVSTFTNKA